MRNFDVRTFSSGSPEKRTRSQASQENVFFHPAVSSSPSFYRSREKNSSSLDRDIELVFISLYPPSFDLTPSNIGTSATGSREVVVIGREERRERELAMAMSATGDRLPVFATVPRGPHTRVLRTHTLTHTYTQRHYACTPPLRFARGQSRRALSLSRVYTRSRTYVRTHARTHI